MYGVLLALRLLALRQLSGGSMMACWVSHTESLYKPCLLTRVLTFLGFSWSSFSVLQHLAWFRSADLRYMAVVDINKCTLRAFPCQECRASLCKPSQLLHEQVVSTYYARQRAAGLVLGRPARWRRFTAEFLQL
jgi:hypothetical protein